MLSGTKFQTQIFLLLFTLLCIPMSANAIQVKSLNVNECKIPKNYQQSLSPGFPRDPALTNSLGLIRSVVIHVDFPDNKSPQLVSDFQVNFSKEAEKFLENQSYGRANFVFDVPGTVFRINKDSSSYKIVRDGQGDTRGLIQDAINAADESIDFTSYQFVTVVPPRDTKTILFSGAMVGGAESFSSNERNFSSAIWIGKNKLENFNSPGSGWSFYAHEIGHVLGITHPYFQRDGGPGAIWDLMGNGGTSVPEFIGWHRFLLSWLNDNEVICLSKDLLKRQQVLITPINSNSSRPKVLIVRINSLQALFLEVRRSSKYDKLRKDEIGAIVYRVDVSKGDDEGIITVLGNKGTKREGQTLETITRGEKIQSDGITFQVISSSKIGDTIRVSRVKDSK